MLGMLPTCATSSANMQSKKCVETCANTLRHIRICSTGLEYSEIHTVCDTCKTQNVDIGYSTSKYVEYASKYVIECTCSNSR